MIRKNLTMACDSASSGIIYKIYDNLYQHLGYSLFSYPVKRIEAMQCLLLGC